MMKDVNTKIILNVELENLELVAKLNIFSQELSLSIDELVLYSIEKLVNDIEYVRKLRH